MFDTTAYAGFWKIAESVADASSRFLCLCGLYAHGIRVSDGSLRKLADEHVGLIEPALEAIDSISDRIDVGYEGVAYLASIAPQFARSLLRTADHNQRVHPLTGVVPAKAYRDIVRLAIRAFGGILAQGLESEGHERTLESLIQRVPAASDQVVMWSAVAWQHIRHKRSDSARELVRRFIRPLLDSIASNDRQARRTALREALPVLFAANKGLTLEQLDAIPEGERDDHIYDLCRWLSRGTTASEPYEDVHGRAPEADYDSLVDICNLMERCNNEATIWSFCGTVAEIISHGGRYPLTAQQRADIARRLRAIVSSKLPHPHGINHDGPAVLSEANIARIDKPKTEVWSSLVERARLIDNHADRCLVLYSIAGFLPKNDKVRASKLTAEATSAAEAMPTSLDKIERLVDLGEAIAGRDDDSARRVLRRACVVAKELNTEGNNRSLGRLLDVAYRIDEDLAQALAKELDGDEARSEMRKRANDRVRLLHIKKKIGSGAFRDRVGKEDLTAREYVRAAGMALGALNAGLKRPQGLTALREGGAVASLLPLDVANPLYIWIIENVARSPDRSPEMRSAVAALFQAAVTAADLTCQLVERVAGERHATAVGLQRLERTGLVAGAGERDKVFDFIRNWCTSRAARFISICDRYFGPTDLDLIELISWAVPEAGFRVITAKSHQDREGVVYPYKDAYRRAWSSLADRDPPYIDVIVVGDVNTGNSPIHDRWLFTDRAGLSFGTSSNSIGRTTLSEIRELAEDEIRVVATRLEPVVLRSARVYEGHRVEFDSFSL